MADDDDKPSWNVLMLIGTIAGIAFGALLVLLFRERRQQSQLSGSTGSASPITIYNGYPTSNDYPQGALAPTGYPALPEAPPFATKDNVSLSTRTNTYTLSSSKSLRIFSAPRSGPTWRVQIHVIGPAGGFGMFSIDQPLPEEQNSNLDMGSPQGFIIPASSFSGPSNIFIGPRQTLYAKAGGTECDVQVSIIASASV